VFGPALLRWIVSGAVSVALLLPWCALWLDLGRAAADAPVGHRTFARRVVVLGFDGVDPKITAEYLDRLPAIARLAREGTFVACRSTNPPESPVAWATFLTGRNPGGHGIFDFVRRDPSSDDPYLPRNGMVDRIPPSFGPFGVPLRAPAARNLRSGECFWEPIARAGFRVEALRVPVAFPPVEPRGGNVLCGLGVPDLRGTNGSYTLFASGRDASPGHTVFGGRHVKIYPRGGVAKSVLEGPPDPRGPDAARRLSIEIVFRFTEAGAFVELPDQAPIPLVKDRYSRWARVVFRAGPFVRLHGLVRFLLLQDGPEPSVYASPIQLAPHAPPVPISAPPAFSKELAARLGPMKTAGWPEDTFGANDRVLNDAHVFADIRDTYEGDERLLLDRLDRAGAALVTMIFTAPDRTSHMFFRWRDPKHPAYDPAARAAFRERTGIDDPIFESYSWMDRTIERVLARLRAEDVLIVVSDHGFHSWRTGVNLNTWLAREGYLALARPAGAPRNLHRFFAQSTETDHIDWSRTRAYALGLGQIYLNVKGREAEGVVEPGDAAALADEIAGKLLALRSPEGEAVFTSVYRGRDIWRGERTSEAPELQCAFAEGFRVSWQTALLGAPEGVFETNDYPWSGDHCSNDVAQTHGVFLSNKKLGRGAGPGLEDIGPTVCAIFGVPPPRGADGRPLPIELER
jgi:predicted AlkP superfamily phosphohydrolase/phosphomutase